MAERGPPDISSFGRAVASLNSTATKPALVVVGSGALLSTSGGEPASASGGACLVYPQVAEVLAALRSKGVPLALLAAAPPTQLQPLLEQHALGPFAHTVRAWLTNLGPCVLASRLTLALYAWPLCSASLTQYHPPLPLRVVQAYSSDGPADALRGLRSQKGVQFSDMLLFDSGVQVGHWWLQAYGAARDPPALLLPFPLWQTGPALHQRMP